MPEVLSTTIERGVTASELQRVVIRLANALPVRYYLDVTGRGEYTRVAIEIHFTKDRFPGMIDRQLTEMGFTHTTNPNVSPWQGTSYIRRWEAKRARDEYGEIIA